MADFQDTWFGGPGNHSSVTVVDPLGLFRKGGILGSPDQSAQQAQAEFLQRMMGREGDLYPELKQKLTDSGLLNDQALQAIQSGTGPAYDKAMQTLGQVSQLAPEQFKAAVGPSQNLFGKTVSDINTAGDNAQSFNLPPEALSALNKIREDRLSGISGDINNLIGSKISDYARRGVTSSTTAEGMGGEVMKAAAPTINQAESDYQAARLALPGQLYNLAKDKGLTTYGMGVEQGNIDSQAYKDLMSSMTGGAMNQYNLAAGQSQLQSGALKDKATSLINPFLDMWKASAGIGGSPPQQPSQNTAGASAIGGIAGAIGKLGTVAAA